MFTIIRYIVAAVACAWERWSDKQQDIYDDHRAWRVKQ